MPIYEFYCSDCKKTFDLLLSMKADLTQVTCTHCESRQVSKKVSNFATGSSGKTFDLSEPSGGDSGGGSGCGSCSSHSCGSCSHH